MVGTEVQKGSIRLVNMRDKLKHVVGFLAIFVLLFFGSKVAKRAYNRDIAAKPSFGQADCIKLAYRTHGRHGMVDKIKDGKYIVKFYNEVPAWSYDFDDERYYDPYYQVVEEKVYSIREGNQFFEHVNCPSSIIEKSDE